MKTLFTINDLKKSPVAALNQHLWNLPKQKKEKKVSKEKVCMERWLKEFADARHIELTNELVFHPARKWRFDWAFEELKIAIEYEGIFSEKSRHTTVKGFTGDANKYNSAQSLGWTVYRYTAINYLDLKVDLLNIK